MTLRQGLAMSETGTWQGIRVLAAGERGRVGQSCGARRARLGLWTLLHAHALLAGTIGGTDGVAFIEDDRRRLTGRLHAGRMLR
jgi:hypothetical protein